MLIIYAHPNKDGHCGYFLESIIDYLNSEGTEYEIIDLYQMAFGPILKNEEHYTSGHNEIADEVIEIQEKIRKTNRFIFIYPTWWQNMPSLLKGFVDRIFLPKFAFSFVYNGIIPKGHLKSKKAVIFTSTGAQRIFTKLLFSDRSVKVLKKDVLWFCGMKSKAFVADNARKFTDSQKNKIKKLVHSGMKYIHM